MPENEFFDAEGNFTDEFRTQLPTLVGDSFKDADGNASKVFDDVPNFAALLKNHVDINRAFGKKQDNVIQKPGEAASDDDKASYIKTLAGEIGLSKTVEDIKFTERKVPEGMEVKEKMVAGIKQLAVEKGIPDRYLQMVKDFFDDFQEAEFNTKKDTELKEFTEASDEYEKDFLGDKGIENGRIAFNAISKFNADNPEMLKIMNKSGVFDDPTNLGLWKSIGIMPSDLRSWGLIGEEMGVSSSPSGDVHKPGGGGSLQEQIDAMYPNTPDELKKVTS